MDRGGAEPSRLKTELRDASDPCLDFDPDPEAAAALRKSQIHAGMAIVSPRGQLRLSQINLVVALSSSLSSSLTIRQHPIAHPSRFSSCQTLSYIQVDNLINASSHLGSTEPGLIFPHSETSSADQPGSPQIRQAAICIFAIAQSSVGINSSIGLSRPEPAAIVPFQSAARIIRYTLFTSTPFRMGR
ncbi:hypothetical protein NDA11_000695 [Ustilago hordei]|uniref:Uncharacterized protein n=1 Tax=Ustilago hordei TaxID=120017 RepID=I2G4L5_USTHO|nr:uncharacterized protein UHO2_01253 [Ustilago hordei]KAJ1044544.1 hypothetical protein NDA10_004979 [Ustilago hordei]KAJ1583678.1 hypothetical protein NDA15_005761 [Ustilago hordei]KAJ1586465.1 hypothetical protein NDA11_000695 [Ustilago hordei]KAJ1591981.1 hypothetical protein NDA12_004494 [Ustilago hordei]KAJ1603422.1 hypothetical protein NDA14_006531 [Ustilago hordei]